MDVHYHQDIIRMRAGPNCDCMYVILCPAYNRVRCDRITKRIKISRLILACLAAGSYYLFMTLSKQETNHFMFGNTESYIIYRAS
jgi:hypothetical protein